MAYDFSFAGECKKSREVIIKAWTKNYNEAYETERKAYNILSTSPMKGCPSFFEGNFDPSRKIHVLVLEKLGPTLEDVRSLMSPNKRFDEKMTLALAIQMVCGFFFSLLFISCTYYSYPTFSIKLDRYADLHDRKIIHNGARPANICVTSHPSNTSDTTTLYLIDFAYSHFCDKTKLDRGEDFPENKRFCSILSYHAFSEFFYFFLFFIICYICPLYK